MTGEEPRTSPLSAFEARVPSQNGEDGVIAEILDRIGGPRTSWFVEFGAGRGDEANCVVLADERGWSGLFMEADAADFRALAAKYSGSGLIVRSTRPCTADNVEELLSSAGVPGEVRPPFHRHRRKRLLGVGGDPSFSPRLVVIEYNANLPLERALVMPRDDAHVWDGTDYVGASLAAYRALGAEKGYELVHTDSTGVNAFFVRGRRRVDSPGGPTYRFTERTTTARESPFRATRRTALLRPGRPRARVQRATDLFSARGAGRTRWRSTRGSSRPISPAISLGRVAERPDPSSPTARS